MNKLTWNDSNYIGMEQFDSQHRLLIGLLNSLIELEVMPPALQKQLHGQFLHDLMEAIHQHFDAEERFMRSNSYPDNLLKPHIDQHYKLIAELHEFIRRYNSYSQPLTDEMVAYLYKWLVLHIRERDLEMSRFFAGKPTSP